MYHHSHHHEQHQQQQHYMHLGAKVTPAPSATNGHHLQHHQHQHPQHSHYHHHAPSEIEAFRARQRMQLRHVSHDERHGNQADGLGGESMGAFGGADDDRVRKLSLSKRLQQQQQQHQSSSQTRLTKLPNFSGTGGGVVRQYEAYSDECGDMPSPVPVEPYSLFNAFDFGSSPEAFDEPPLGDPHGAGGDLAARHGAHADDKSLWRRRFDAHERRSPKLGKAALWDSPSAPDDNQLGHHLAHHVHQAHQMYYQHQHQPQYENHQHGQFGQHAQPQHFVHPFVHHQ